MSSTVLQGIVLESREVVDCWVESTGRHPRWIGRVTAFVSRGVEWDVEVRVVAEYGDGIWNKTDQVRRVSTRHFTKAELCFGTVDMQCECCGQHLRIYAPGDRPKEAKEFA